MLTTVNCPIVVCFFYYSRLSFVFTIRQAVKRPQSAPGNLANVFTVYLPSRLVSLCLMVSLYHVVEHPFSFPVEID